MQVQLQAQVFGMESFNSKAGKPLRMVKALVAVGDKTDSVKVFLPPAATEPKMGAATLVCHVGVTRDGGLGLFLDSVAAPKG